MTPTPSLPPSLQRVRLGSVPDQTGETAAFLRDRLAFYSQVMFLLSGIFYIVFAGVQFAMSGHGIVTCLFDRGNGAHLALTLVLAALWSIARFGRPSPRMVEHLDATALLMAGLLIARMGYEITSSGETKGLSIALLAFVHAALARAIIVPSTARRTAWITGVAALPIIPVQLLLQAPVARAEFIESMVSGTLWLIAVVVLSTVASRVIYGLHEKVRAARQLGQYTLEERIGEGGMGQVYRASHTMLRRPTAVKLLAGEEISQTQLARFEREVQLTSLLTHPNTISVYDYGHTPDGVFYYAMEYLSGFNLDALVQRDGPQPAGRVIHILRQICGALGEAHGIGLIHRDVKPANIFLCERGGLPDVVKVLDFGLVKNLDGDTSDSSLTQENVLTGTPLYMSPEAISATRTLDARSDLYALGAVAYYLLTGRPPFDGKTVVEVCAHHLHSTPRPPSALVDVPADLEAVVLRCLQKDPRDRLADTAALDAALACCGDVDAWRVEHGREWWAKRALEVKGSDEHGAATAPTPTLAVDLRDRGALVDPAE